jgi:hypothetical protein
MKDSTLYESLTSGGLIVSTIKSLAGNIVLVCESIFIIFFIIYVGYMYFKHHTFDLNTKKLIESLTNGLLIFGGLAIYIPLANAVVALGSSINDAFALDSDQLMAYFVLYVEDPGSVWSFSWGQFNPLTAILGSIVQIVRLCMLLYSLTMTNILYCFGPFAIIFSLLFPDKFQFWFTTFLNVLFIPLTVAVLDRAMGAILIAGNLLHPDGGIMGNIVLKYSFISMGVVCYSLAPWLTSNFVGNKNAGVVLTVASQYAKQVAMTAASKGANLLGGLGGGAGFGGGGAAGSATQGGKDIIKGS